MLHCPMVTKGEFLRCKRGVPPLSKMLGPGDLFAAVDRLSFGFGFGSDY